MLGLKLGFSAAKKRALNFDIVSDLQAYWTFNQINSNITPDDTGNGHNATLHNMDKGNFVLRGNSAVALAFNGSNERIQTSSFNANTSQCTWAYWLYLPDVTQAEYTRTFQTGDVGDKPDNGVSHEINPDGDGNDRLAFVHWDDNAATLLGTVTVPLEEWTHVTHVVDENDATIYLNGEAVMTGTGSRGTTNEIVCIGAGDENYIQGQIDEVRIYNRALSTNDVAGLYNTEFGQANNIPAITTRTTFNDALSAVQNDTGSARILCVGNSLTFGSWSTGNNTDNNQKQFSYPTYLRNFFVADSIDATEENFIGWGGNNEYNLDHDERFSYSGTPNRSGDWTIGGGAIQLVSGESITFTPNEDVDTFKVYALAYNNAPSLDVDIDGVSTTTITLNAGGSGDALITPVEISAGSPGAHNIKLTWAAGGGSSNAFIYGIEAYDNSQNQVTIFNAGAPSAKVIDWSVTSKPWSPVNSWTYFDPDLVLICLGANEWIAGDNVQTYQNTMADIIEGIQAYDNMDIALIVPPPSNETTYSNQDAYRNALTRLSIIYRIALVDIYTAFGGQAAGDAEGYYVNDDIHLTADGYEAMAEEVYSIIKP